MQPATRAWLEGLRAAVAEPRPPLQASGASAAAERMILAAHLATWIDASPHLSAARRAFAAAVDPEADPDAAIVVTTSPVGIAVVEELLASDEPLARDLRRRVVCATEGGYRSWCMRHPDERHRLHINHWSWIKTRVPRQRDAEFARHPLAAGEVYWLHRTGTAGAGAADGRATHLWKFTGSLAVLLEPFVVEGRGAAPGH